MKTESNLERALRVMEVAHDDTTTRWTMSLVQAAKDELAALRQQLAALTAERDEAIKNAEFWKGACKVERINLAALTTATTEKERKV
jgi:hypothetical protein